MSLKLYDTTLRDGSQCAGISFSMRGKLEIARRLDEVGIDYIEGGWPGSNPKDIEFFSEAKKINFKRSRLVAFGSTRRPNISAKEDLNLHAILEAGTRTATLVGKSWPLHVREALNTTLEENLNMIYDSIAFLKDEGMEVFFDAEHFFDGYHYDPEYAIKTLKAAEEAGADTIVLCDTNGGNLPHQIEAAFKVVTSQLSVQLGIHAHNDSELAVANTLSGVRAGALQVQGTINGYGERCGNANLCSIIPTLQLKMNYQLLSDAELKELSNLSYFISELANMPLNSSQPYVGRNAFAHKGGIHVSAIDKNPETYEHISPDLVGNKRKVLVSELAGKSNVISKARELGLELKDQQETRELVKKVKELENEGYQYEGAEASFQLLLRRLRGKREALFDLTSAKVIVDKRNQGEVLAEATIRLTIGGHEKHTAAAGDGPVNALDKALRKALVTDYPVIKDIRLTDYKVRVIDARDGTSSRVRVLIESQGFETSWSTVGVSPNIIEASWQALVDSIEYGVLIKAGSLEASFDKVIAKID